MKTSKTSDKINNKKINTQKWKKLSFKKKAIVLLILFIFLSTYLINIIYNDLSGRDYSFIFFEKNDSYSEDESFVALGFVEKEDGVLYKVDRVVDGDTIKVYINNKLETIRLIGIDTPETVDPRKKVECFGIEASNKAKEMLESKEVFLEADESQGERDRYGRLLLYVYLEDGTLFNKWMVENGYGHEYTYNIPYKYQAEFKEAERQARESKRGLWADGVCEK